MHESGTARRERTSRGPLRAVLLAMLAILVVLAQAVTRSQSGTPQRSAVDDRQFVQANARRQEHEPRL